MGKLFDVYVDGGIDYVTATCNKESAARRIGTLAEYWLGAEHASGNEVREWAGFGYIGLACGSVQFGSRHDSCLIRVSGRLAHEKVVDIFKLATNCSRIDCQTTVRLVNRDFKFAEYVERRALEKAEGGGRTFAVRLLRDSVSGNTVYLGRRSSDRFMRIYDKGAESQLPEMHGCWRAEIQYNNRLAWQVAVALRGCVFDRKEIGLLVYREMATRGIPWLSPFPGPSILALRLMPPKSRTRADVQLEWLRTQVRPTVVRLRTVFGREALIKTLGLESEKEEG